MIKISMADAGKPGLELKLARSSDLESDNKSDIDSEILVTGFKTSPLQFKSENCTISEGYHISL